MHLLLGNWQLIEALAFDESGLPLPSPFGPQPMGIVRFEAERMAVVVADGRPDLPPESPPRAFLSYTGRYEFDEGRLVTYVDGTSSPAGFADQVRQITFKGPDQMVVVPLSRVLAATS